VISMNTPVTAKPEGQLLLGIQGLISEYERAQIMERTRRGKLHRAKNGEIMGATPYGYEYIPRDKEVPAAYRVNEAEAEVVRLIFSLYLKFRSMRQVIRELANRDIRPRKGGKYWRPSSLYRVLKGEHYIGTAYYNKDRYRIL
jgi:site-specific DNA recombinase